MNISTGISEINLRRAGENSQVSGKSFVWPKYHEGRVDKINSPSPWEREPVYYKPSLADREKLIKSMLATANEYNSYGKTDSRKPFIQPGSFFNALA